MNNRNIEKAEQCKNKTDACKQIIPSKHGGGKHARKLGVTLRGKEHGAGLTWVAEIGCQGARQKASASDSDGFTRSCGRLTLVQLVRRRLLCRGAVSSIWSALARGSFGRTAFCAPPPHRFPTHEAAHRRIPVTYRWSNASVTYGRNGCGLNSGDAATVGATTVETSPLVELSSGQLTCALHGGALHSQRRSRAPHGVSRRLRRAAAGSPPSPPPG